MPSIDLLLKMMTSYLSSITGETIATLTGRLNCVGTRHTPHGSSKKGYGVANDLARQPVNTYLQRNEI